LTCIKVQFFLPHNISIEIGRRDSRTTFFRLESGDDVKALAAKALVLGTSAALATLVATGAARAQDYPSYDAASARSYRAAPEVYNSQGNPRYGFGPRVKAHPHDVITGDSVIGRDPDPFIRGEILRHYNSGWPDP
jgi:hypothetical protein